MKINAITVLLILIAVMTVSVIMLSTVGMSRVTNLPQAEPLPPASDSLEAVAVVIPEVVPFVKGEMIERPLFWKGRRPYIPVEKETEKPVPVAEGPDLFDKIKLVGVYSGGAILIVDGVKQRIHIGEELDGWTFELMDADRVMFVQGSKDRTLQLEHAVVAAPRNKPTNNQKKTEKSKNGNSLEKVPSFDRKKRGDAAGNTPPLTQQQKSTTSNSSEKGRLPMPLGMR